MYRNQTVLIVVPARGGSKGVPLKNLYPLLGRPLLEHTGELVRQLSFVDRAVVSTDNPQIMKVARNCGLEAPFTRPQRLSGDRIGDTEVLVNALEEMERIDSRRYDVVVMLQPTCPLRRPDHVLATITKLIDESWDAVWTVSPTDLKYHPLKQLVIQSDGSMSLFDSAGAEVIARQQLHPTFTRNGAAYALSRGCLLDGRTILPRRTAAVVTIDHLISIDTLDDFRAVAIELEARRANAIV